MLSCLDTIHKANYYCIFPPLGLQQEGYQEHGRYPDHIIVTACLWLLRACMKGLDNKHQCLKRLVCFANRYILLYVQGCIRALPDNFQKVLEKVDKCHQDVSRASNRKLEKSYKNVSRASNRKLKESYKEVSRADSKK